MTVRRCYYALLSAGLVKDGLTGYQSVSRLLKDARLDGSVPWEAIVDNTRSVQQRATWSSFNAIYESAKSQFRKNSLDEQEEYVEVWVEKDAAAGSIYDTTEPLDVPLVVSRGFSSVTLLKNAAERFKEVNRREKYKPITIFYLSDFDPEGNYFPEQVARALEEDHGCSPHTSSVALTVEKLALTKEDIEKNALTWIPLKLNEHHLTKQYVRDYVKEHGNRKVELDAIAGDILAKKLKDALAKHLDLSLPAKIDAESAVEVEDWEHEHLKDGGEEE